MWRLAMILAIEVVACIVLSIQAKAAGSLSFDEVMQLARSNSRLVKEIEEVMRTQKVKPTEISCEAGRFGNHWKYLGGGRSLHVVGKGNALLEERQHAPTTALAFLIWHEKPLTARPIL